MLDEEFVCDLIGGCAGLSVLGNFYALPFLGEDAPSFYVYLYKYVAPKSFEFVMSGTNISR